MQCFVIEINDGERDFEPPIRIFRSMESLKAKWHEILTFMKVSLDQSDELWEALLLERFIDVENGQISLSEHEIE